MEAAELLHGEPHGGAAVAGLAHVGVDEPASQLAGYLGALGIIEVGQDDVGALPGQKTGHSLTDAVAAPGDQGHLPVHVHRSDRRGVRCA